MSCERKKERNTKEITKKTNYDVFLLIITLRNKKIAMFFFIV